MIFRNQVSDVLISFSEAPTRFFAQLEMNQDVLDGIMTCVQKYCLTSENKDLLYLEDAVENMAVCAMYEDDKWYRGLIIDEPDNDGNVTIFYVDFGNQDIVCFKIHLELFFFKIGFFTSFGCRSTTANYVL